jgi:GMP synthase (glutamine-hydrolysing)
MRPIGILVAGEPVPLTLERRGGFGRIIREATGTAWPGEWRELDCIAEQLPDPAELTAVVMSGSPASVTVPEPWMLRTAEWLRRAIDVDTFVLGICFGHQLVCQALGGRVEPNPNGREIGTVELYPVQADPLIDLSQAPLLVNMTHVDSVTKIPAGTRVLARTGLEPHAALRVAERVWSVQFHPEVDAEIMHHYLEARHATLAHEGIDAERLMRELRPASAGAAVLARFARWVRQSTD